MLKYYELFTWHYLLLIVLQDTWRAAAISMYSFSKGK